MYLCAPQVWLITTQVQGVNDIHALLQPRLLRQIQKQMQDFAESLQQLDGETS